MQLVVFSTGNQLKRLMKKTNVGIVYRIVSIFGIIMKYTTYQIERKCSEDFWQILYENQEQMIPSKNAIAAFKEKYKDEKDVVLRITYTDREIKDVILGKRVEDIVL